MFHVEVRQFPHVARAFNLGGDELRERILAPWVGEPELEFQERQWSTSKAKLTIYEGPELTPDQIGLGRGWANATRAGEDVTVRLLAGARSAAVTPQDEATDWLKRELVARVNGGRVPIREALELVNGRCPGWRMSDRLAVAERAVWELLHQGGLRMLRGESPVEPAAWEAVVLDWETWCGTGEPAGIVLTS
jgi:hypothetical protein